MWAPAIFQQTHPPLGRTVVNISLAPSTYEIINPADFGMNRYVHFASRITGWNAIKVRVEQLGLQMTDDQIKEA